jgi:hypothetical protein
MCDSVAKRLQRTAINNAGLPPDVVFCCAGTGNIGSAYRLILLHSRFCESFGRMLHNLLLLATNPQVSIRSRSLKALLPIIEADRSVIDHIPIVKALISSKNYHIISNNSLARVTNVPATVFKEKPR